MDRPRIADAAAVVASLSACRADVILVGGVAAILHGSTLGTAEVDFVRRCTAENSERLLAWAVETDAWFRRDPARRRLRPDASHFSARGALLLSTVHGPVDLLATIDGGKGFDDLLPHTEIVQLGDVTVRLLDLPTLIEVKSRVGRPKDKLVAAELIAILRQRLGS